MSLERRPDGASVVVPAIDAPSSVACLRSLGRRGVRTIAASERANAAAFASKYCDEAVTVPAPAESLSAYGDALLSLARRRDVRTIVPVREEDVYVLATNRDAFAEHVESLWPSVERLRSAQDRVRLFDAAERADVGAPETALLSGWDDWDRDVVVKPRYTISAPEYLGASADSDSTRGSTTYVGADDEPDFDGFVSEMGHEPIVQTFVPGPDEYGFFALYDDGEAVATFQHRQRRGYKYWGGPSAYRESVAIPELDAAGRRLLDELEWHGLAMVEFLRGPDGEFRLMEVNPRFWSSLPFTVQAGVDFPALYWTLATGYSPDAPDYDVGVAGHLLRGELLYLHSVFRETAPVVERPSRLEAVADVAASLVRHPRFDYLDPDDSRPFVRDLHNAFSTVAGDTRSADRSLGTSVERVLGPARSLVARR